MKRVYWQWPECFWLVSLISAGTTVPVLAVYRTLEEEIFNDDLRIGSRRDQYSDFQSSLTAHMTEIIRGSSGPRWELDFDDETTHYTFHMAEDKWQDGELWQQRINLLLKRSWIPKIVLRMHPTTRRRSINVIDDHCWVPSWGQKRCIPWLYDNGSSFPRFAWRRYRDLWFSVIRVGNTFIHKIESWGWGQITLVKNEGWLPRVSLPLIKLAQDRTDYQESTS